MEKKRISPQKQKALTLIELLIVIGIVGILSSIGFNWYMEKIQTAYRSEAQSALLQMQQAMERFYTENNTYIGTHDSGVPKATFFPSTAPLDASDPKYNLTIVSAQTSYTLTATPLENKMMSEDGPLTLAHTGQKTHNGTSGWN